MQKNLPREITSYDLLKAAAVIIMVIDHTGLYLYWDQLWWRAIGRIGFPIWFFLVGYARSREIPPRLWAGAAVLGVANFFAGLPIFPLNALVTIILIRLTIEPVMRFALQGKGRLAAVAILMLLLIAPSCWLLSEYGTQAMCMAMFGYAVRRRAVVNGGRYANGTIIFMGLWALLCFVGFEQLNFKFPPAPFAVMAGGTTLVMAILYRFSPAVYPRLTAACPAPLRLLVQFMGRYTLEIYVFHLLLLKALGLWLRPSQFRLFNWHWSALR